MQITNQLVGGLQITNQLVGGLEIANQLVGGSQTANQLVGGLQTANQLAGGLQTTNQLVGGLQTANQLGKVGKWVGSGRGSSRLVQNDQRDYRNVFKRVSAKDSLKKQWKNMIFRFISRPPPPPPRRRPRRRPLSTPVWGPLLESLDHLLRAVQLLGGHPLANPVSLEKDLYAPFYSLLFKP